MDATGVVIGLAGLIWDCYSKCKNNTATFHDLARDYRSLTTLLREAERNLPYGGNFDPIRAGCKQIAVDIEKMLEKYADLGSGISTRSPWQLFRWSLEDIEQLRSRLISQVVMLNASSTLFIPRAVRFDVQSQTVLTKPSQTLCTPLQDNDQIWYEIFQALHASNASESSLEVVRSLVLERSTTYVPCVDSTPIVVTPDSSGEFPIDTINLIETSSRGTHYSMKSSNSSTSTGKKVSRSISAALKSKKSKFTEAARNVDFETLLELRARVDVKVMHKALLEVVQTEDIIPGQADVVRVLLTSGAHPEHPDSFYHRTPLILATLSRRIDLIDPLLEAGAHLETPDGRRHNTPFIWAIYKNDSATLRKLIERGANVHVTDRITTYPPLILAAHMGYLYAARTLLEHDRRFIKENDEDGLTPLAIAYTKRNLELAELFLKYDHNKDFVWPSGLSLLAMAVVEKQIDFIRLFVNKGVSITQTSVVPALAAAVKQQVPSTVQYLLDKLPVDERAALDTRDSKGGTALLWALWLKNERIVEMLVAAGADTSIKDSDNVSVQQWAWWTKNKRIIASVAQNGRDGYVHQAELPG
ncbi:ankyrin [Lentithecium fluviatile CBS 122367]|uniref:Ankyrin n=1 Tax=Lentithecium fluviatile CBS 122367 TaxID=1168545 RepID=A0A6G1J558_9PLEO|nr:ankyrin [Lentithecium fluviatile CBS 122367]